MGDEVAKVLRGQTFEILLPLVSTTTAKYGFENFLARVERLPKDGTPGEVRYGVLTDLEDGTGYGQNLVLLEIPTSKSGPAEIEAEQTEFIKDHIKRMRTEWQSYLKKFDKDGLTVDQFDTQRRFTQSVDGRWQILRGFRLNENVAVPTGTERGNYKPISDEMLPDVTPGTDAFAELLARQLFPFIEGEEYKVSIDWVIPYICLEDAGNANHIDTPLPSPSNRDFFFPFHNFQFERPLPAPTKFTATVEQILNSTAIELEATYHVPLAYFTYAVDQVEAARAEIEKKLKPYATYVAKLSAAQAILQTYGPLKEKSGAELVQISKLEESDYDGGVSDPDDAQDPAHLSEQALGLMDVIEARDIFLQVIEKETEIGRAQSDAVTMEQWAGILADVFYAKASSPVPGRPVKFAVKELYEDLWVHNIDPYGYELYSLKSNQIISQSSSGKSVQKDFMNTMVYENPLLQSHSAKLLPKVQLWTDQMYRSVNLLATTWQFYYTHRDTDLRLRSVAQVRSEIPDPGKIMNFYKDFAVRNLPAGVREIDGPLALVWEVTDEQVAHLVRFLLGDTDTTDVAVAEQRLAFAVRQLLTGTRGLPEFKQIDLLRKYAEEVKLDLIRGKVLADDLRKVEGVGSKVNFAISLFSLGLAMGAHKRNAGVVDTAKLVTVGLGVVADFGAMAAHLARIETAVLQNTAGTITRVGLGIGRFSVLFGGVGGAVGVLWTLYDAVGALKEGRREDALLDGISAVAIAMTTVGLGAGATGVGLALAGLGIAVLIIAQTIKFLRRSEVENTTRSLYTAALHEGMDSFDLFKDELDNDTVKGPFDTIPKKEAVKALLDRIDEFFRDKDTFDLFPKTVAP